MAKRGWSNEAATAVPWLFICLWLTTTAAVCAAESESTTTIVRSMSTDLPFDENNRLATHALVYVDSPACTKHGLATMKADRFQVFPVEGYAQDQVFGSTPPPSEDEVCQAACVERGVERSLAGAIMPHKYYDNTQPFAEWFFETCTKVEVCFINYHNRDGPISSFWLPSDGETKDRRPHMPRLEYGERKTRCFTSFLGHRFHIEDPSTNTLLADLTIEHVTVRAFGSSPPSDSREEGYQFEMEIRQTLHSEWRRHNRVTRSFSPLGFKKGRLPDDVFASMGALFYNNQRNVVLEEWGGRGVFVNWWETQVFLLQVPWSMKELYQKRLRTMVEEWAGVPLEETAMYGLRQYTEGARLLTHVDHHQTHAVSLIVNVAQGNLTEPWPVEVQDHMDRLHEVIMKPGDVVYYESAKCLHARNRPMMGKGAYYVNLFTHYKPIVEGDWWNQPNLPGTPEPVMEVEGNCRLVPMGTSSIAPFEGKLGLVKGVECDDKRLGPYVSPSLFSASGPDDMIRWWQMTSPAHQSQALPGSGASQARDEL